MIWLIVICILVAFAFLPLGVRFVYNSEGVFVDLLLGPVPISVYPNNKSGKSDSVKKSKDKKTSKKLITPGTVKAFRPVAELVLKILGDLRRRVCVRCLQLRLILAGDDPADVAIHYGESWAVLGALVPRLDELFRIKKREFSLQCDFTASTPMVYARMDATISSGRLLWLLMKYAKPAIEEYRKFKNLSKGGTEL